MQRRLEILFVHDIDVSISPSPKARMERLKIKNKDKMYATPCNVQTFDSLSGPIEVCDLDTDDGVIQAVPYYSFQFVEEE